MKSLPSNSLDKYLGISTAYVVWSNDTESWYRPKTRRTVLTWGLWRSEEDIEKDITIKNYQILPIDLSAAPEALSEIASLEKDFGDGIKDMAISKMRQYFEVFIFRNQELKKHMKQQWINNIHVTEEQDG